MAPEEPRIVLSSSRWVELGTTVFFAVSGVIIATSHVHRTDGWYAIAACAAFVFVGVAGLIERPRLEVSGGMMTDVGLLRRKSFDLRHCGRFHAQLLRLRGGRWVVTFPYGDKPKAYVDSHGHDGEEVARLLNQARDRARRTGG
jgi:hypothetical protein